MDDGPSTPSSATIPPAKKPLSREDVYEERRASFLVRYETISFYPGRQSCLTSAYRSIILCSCLPFPGKRDILNFRDFGRGNPGIEPRVWYLSA
jgi:hypothetical protein